MHVLIDGQSVDVEVSGQLPLGGLVERVRAKVATDRRVLANMSIGGSAIEVDELEQWLARPCGQVAEVRFETACPRALARGTVGGVRALFADSTVLQQEAAGRLAAGQTVKAMEALTGCLGLYKAAQEAVSQAVRLNRLDLDRLRVGGRSMGQTIGELTARLGEVKSALEDRDLVLLGDLLTYEFPHISEQWMAILAELDKRLAG